MPLLAIETTCDETAAAVITRSRDVLSSVVASQDALHARWRGVVPEVASRAHVERIIPVIEEAVSRSGLTQRELEAVAVAVTPGLVGSLLVGLAAAKGIAATLDIPIIGYDHIAAHLYACRLAHGDALRYPCVGLVASGGHTSLFHVRSPLELERLGGTIDDAAGEELFRMQAERDRESLVKRDESVSVGRHLTKLVAADEREDTGKNRVVHVGLNRSAQIGGSDTIAKRDWKCEWQLHGNAHFHGDGLAQPRQRSNRSSGTCATQRHLRRSLRLAGATSAWIAMTVGSAPPLPLM